MSSFELAGYKDGGEVVYNSSYYISVKGQWRGMVF